MGVRTLGMIAPLAASCAALYSFEDGASGGAAHATTAQGTASKMPTTSSDATATIDVAQVSAVEASTVDGITAVASTSGQFPCASSYLSCIIAASPLRYFPFDQSANSTIPPRPLFATPTPDVELTYLDSGSRNSALFVLSQDYITVVDMGLSAVVENTKPFSVELWIKAELISEVNPTLFEFLHPELQGGISLSAKDSQIRFSRGGTSTIGGTSDDLWRHVVGVYTGSEIQLYVDGKLETSAHSAEALPSVGWNPKFQWGGTFDNQRFHPARPGESTSTAPGSSG